MRAAVGCAVAPDGAPSAVGAACLPGAGVLLMGVRRRHEGAVVAC